MTIAALTELQLAVMQALWKVEQGTLAEVHQAMAEDGKALAPTTVATMLQRLSKQGWVTFRKDGRQFIYQAKVSREQAAKGAVQRLARSFFGGSLPALAAQLIDSDQLSPAELAAMRKLISKKGG